MEANLSCRKIIIFLAVVCAILATSRQDVLAAEEMGRPNIILFVADDHGPADSGAYGDSVVRTPNIDRLAKESLRFTRAFAVSPLCSPSRSVIATGLDPFRNGAHKFGTPIASGIRTMPEYFKSLGYYTAHFGKFHHMPRQRFPYDHIASNENNAAEYLARYDKPQPLLLVVCTHPPHTPWIKNKTYDPEKIKLPANYIDTPETRLDRANYYSDVTLMDSILGSVLDAANKNGFVDNTLLLYTSDQGANWPFEKWCLYDGGLRVPLIIRWPGVVRAGTTTDAMVTLADLLPTMIDAAGSKAPADLDGRSFTAVLRGETDTHREVVFGSHTGNDNGGPGIWNHCPARTVRTATHRYILNLNPSEKFTTHITGCKSGPHYLPFWDSWVRQAKTDPAAAAIVNRYHYRPTEELYDLRTDPLETKNLAADPAQAEILESLRKKLREYRGQQGDSVLIKD